MLRVFLSSTTLLVLTSCASIAEHSGSYVLNYGDFGPQSMAFELIGNEWWQWQDYGYYRPRKYDIKVIVYRNIALDKVKQLYPVDPDKNMDYRYVEYNNVINYLDRNIKENVIRSLTKELSTTKNKIIKALGS